MKIKNNIFLSTVAVAVMVIMISACSKYPGFKKAESGLLYKFFVENKDSLKPKEGDILIMDLKYQLKIKGKDSVIFNTDKMPRKFEITLQKSDYKGDIFEAFAMLHKGDSAAFMLNAKDFFIKTARAPQIPFDVDSNAMMRFDVKLIKSETVIARQQAEKAKAEKFRVEEPARIAAFLKSENITAAPSASGVYVSVKEAGEGRGIAKTDYVTMNLNVLSIDGKKIFSSSDNGEPITFEYGQPFDTKGFDEAIGKMKKGTKATIVVPSAMAFGEQGRADQMGNMIIDPFSPIVYGVEITDIKPKAEFEKAQKAKEAEAKKAVEQAQANEPLMMQQYLKDNKITAKPTASGLYYIEKVKGKGAKAAAGKRVKVHYTGKLLNGKVFDSSLERKPAVPLEFVLGQGQVIPGWEEGISLMNAGGKATLVIPSKIGYGSQGNGDVIPPYSPLVFEVELVSVSDK